MGLLYLLFQFLAALLVVRLAYVHLDVRRRRKRFEKEGVVVLYQWFHFANYIINILPRGGLWTWLFPYRYPQLADDMPGHFKKYNTNFIVFVSWNFQEVFTNDPKIVKEIAVTRRKEFPKPDHAYEALRLFGENIVTAIDEEGEWKKHRSIVGPAFSEGNNAFVADSTKYHLNKLMDTWNQDMQNGEVAVDLDAEMVRLALAVIGQAGLGLDLTTAVDIVPAKDGVMHKMCLRDSLQNVCKYLLPRLLIPIPMLYLPFGIFKEVRVSFDEFRIYMRDFCVERTAALGKRNTHGTPVKEKELRKETRKADLLSKLLENNTVLTPDEIFGDIFIFLVAGHETTAHTLGWAVRLLALHPDKQEKLYQEAIAVLGDREPSYEDFDKLVFSRCVMKETLRLYPQVGGIPKWNDEEVELGGHSFPPKTMYSFSVQSLHKHDMFWKSPEEFLPERFDSRQPDYKSPDPYAYVPFSVGRRGCLGSKFAQVEGTIALSMLARAYKIELPSGCTDRSFIFAKTTLLTTQAKNEIRMVLKKREMERGESCRVSSQLF